ncbi:MAG TPA: hypothetical protein VGB95_03580 [Chitinophagales bacterium]
MASQEYNLVHVLRILNKWKKHILIITVSATILTAVFSWFFMKDYFMSSARLFPINVMYTDRYIMFNTGDATHIPYFGEKEDVGRLLGVATSEDVKQYLINKHNLVSVYEIDTTEKYWKTKLYKEFDENYKAIKSDEGAVEISLLDTKPERAKDIIEDAIQKIDDVHKMSIEENRKAQYAIFTEQIKQQEAAVERNADSLGVLAKQHGISIRGTGVNESIEGANPANVEKFRLLYNKQKDAITNLSTNRKIQEQLKITLDAKTNSLAVVAKPYVADRKEKPKRSIIVLTAAILALVVSTFGALALEEINEIRKQI